MPPERATRADLVGPATVFVLVNLVWVTAVWLALTGLEPGSFVVGVPTVLVATLIMFRLHAGPRLMFRPGGLVQFIYYFTVQSLSGGFDVGRRALRPSLPLHPDTIEFETRLPAGSVRWFFCACTNLFPGTCVIGIESKSIRIHVLDVNGNSEGRLQQLEERVAAMFGIELKAIEASDAVPPHREIR